MQLQEHSIGKNFWRFAIPSMVAMLVNGMYQIIDGLFVGHYIGYEGLAAINLAWPVIGILTGIGVLIGMGAGTLMSIFRGEQNRHQARHALFSGIVLTVIAGLLMTGLLSITRTWLMTQQGAEGHLLAMGEVYLRVFSTGAIFTIAAGAMPMLVRNLDRPNLATWLMATGAVLNIALDYVFIGVMQWGLEGAAIATIIAQALITIAAVGYCFTRHSPLKLTASACRFKLPLASQIVKLGVSQLFMYAYFSFVLAIHNTLFMSYGTPVHVGAFAIIGYLVTLYYLLAEGIAMGMQPPVSYYLGAKQHDRIKATVILASKVVVFIGIAAVSLLNLYPDLLANLFAHGDAALMAETVHGIRLHLFGLFLDGFIVLSAVYFMAMNQGGKALFISAGNMMIQLPFLYWLPKMLGIDGIWLAMPLSNIALAMIVIPMMWHDLHRKPAVVAQSTCTAS
ncbi:MATE family efflux transporter [Photobacterium ganghwense]|uniref:MATE family efflux transporter n=1 Tax=Photobacterium ganghwense TaxID=320778 RepID=UPI001C2DABD8|nr:MATE family efflux transporter [Photobacterium ganghwense]MBV1841461.1 MATE family efflux transporter [Photobacterium ganghwense]